MTSPAGEAAAGFAGLGLSAEVLRAVESVGYETPSQIQADTIPPMAAGRDLIGQAQTGTGKTAAFALPLLSNVDLSRREPQILVLAPTRELAIQVAEAFQRYAAHLPGFHVLPIYGGQSFSTQLRAITRGVHAIVATPGRLCDHLRRGTLKLDTLSCVVLDEADEMLRMGFIEEVEWILERTPGGRQIALFSATMPDAIRRIAQRFLNDPVHITVKSQTTTASTVNQRFWMVSGLHKLDALTRILEGESVEAMIVFVRTKTMTTELAERLEARGFETAALNGDIPQNQREATVEKLKSGALDIIVATDVAARGLDVSRVSHVVNYDIPYDSEAYVHRIGRTGRAGRTGEAILFVAPRERRLLASIERSTGQKITPMQLPSRDTINDVRVEKFLARITDTLKSEEGLGEMRPLLEDYVQRHNVPAIEVATALAKMAQGDQPLLLPPEPKRAPKEPFTKRGEKPERPGRYPDKPAPDRVRSRERATTEKPVREKRRDIEPDIPRETYRVEVGREHGVQPGNLVGAIANEGGLEGRFIGKIDIREDHTLVDLPEGMPREIRQVLRMTRVAGRPLRIEKVADAAPKPAPAKTKKPGRKTSKQKKK